MTLSLEPNIRVFVAGVTQSGKTFFIRRLVSMLENFIVYDIKRQYSDLGAVVHSIDDLRKAFFEFGCTKIVMQPLDLSVDFFDLVCKFIFFNLKNLTLIVEEVQTFVTKHFIPQYFKSLIVMSQGECNGIASNIGVYCISQRPANVHNDVITQSTVIVCFALHPDDADAIKRIPVNTILSLERFCFVVFDSRKPFCDSISVFSPL